MPGRLRSILIEFTSALLITLFLYAAFSKIITHISFEAVIAQSPLLKGFSTVLSWSVPSVEIVIAALLFIPGFRKMGFLSSFLLMSIFTLYIIYMLLFTPRLPCSCGGVLKNLNWKEHLIFNFCFTALAFIGWQISKKNKDFIAINRLSRTPVENSRHS